MTRTMPAQIIDRRPIALEIVLSGDIDLEVRDDLLRLLLDVRDRWVCGPLVLDVSAVTFADSTFAAIASRLEALASHLGTCLRVTGADPRTFAVLWVCGLGHLTVPGLCDAPDTRD